MPVEKPRLRGLISSSNLREVRRLARDPDPDRQEAGEPRGDDRELPHRRPATHGSTTTGAIGVSANVSGAYIASTREGGSWNVPSWFTTITYSTRNGPWGT